jgi:hypothetical protein
MGKFSGLTRRGAIWYFRLTVPEPLRPIIGPSSRSQRPREIVQSLHTSDRKEAEKRYHAAALAACERLEAAWKTYRERIGNPDALAEEWLRRELVEDAEVRATWSKTDDDAEAEASYLADHAEETQHALRFGDFNTPSIRKFLAEACATLGVAAPSDDGDESRRLAFALVKARAEYLRVALKRADGDWSDNGNVPASPPVPPMFTPLPSAAALAMVELEENPRLSAVLEKWKAERRPVSKTEHEGRTAVKRFTEVIGDLPVRAITKPNVAAFMDALMEMPDRTGLRRMRGCARAKSTIACCSQASRAWSRGTVPLCSFALP